LPSTVSEMKVKLKAKGFDAPIDELALTFPMADEAEHDNVLKKVPAKFSDGQVANQTRVVTAALLTLCYKDLENLDNSQGQRKILTPTEERIAEFMLPVTETVDGKDINPFEPLVVAHCRLGDAFVQLGDFPVAA